MIPLPTGYLFKGPAGKNSRKSLNSLAIAAQICPVLIREHEIAQISHEYQEIKTENDKKYENYLLLLACTYCANKKRVKNGKKGQKRSKKAKNSLGHPLPRAKKEFIALII